MIVTLVIVLLAVAVGLWWNRRVWRPGQEADQVSSDGLQMKEITGPLATLAVLLLAFVLVQSFSSWSNARHAEAREATASLLLFQEADLIENPRLRQDMRKQVICYATSVIEQEWPAMRESRLSNVPSYWSTSIRRTAIRQVRSGADENAGSAIIDRDRERATARQERLAEAEPAVPPLMHALLVLAVAVALVLVSVVTATGVSARVHLVVVITAGFVFAATLLLIRDLDQPYDGVNAREPTRTVYLRSEMEQEVVGDMPCDARGLPVESPLFRPQTAALH
jgi:hypothetical protein